MITKEQAKKDILKLVERFENQIESYKKSDYGETQTRRDFIDPFFKALGWDIDNSQGYAEAYREVIHEDKIKIGGATKAPDYSFRLPGGKRLFFVEAKKPSVAVKDDIAPAYQIRRYGWSAKLPISIITDFEEFAVYDCTKKPNPNDKASTSRIEYFTFREYEKRFDFIWDTFSKEQVLKGSFDKYIKSDSNKKGTTSVDKEFLISLDNWRTIFAENLVKNNKKLDEDEINFIVQHTLDRIVFLRIAEDRSIEPYGNLKKALNKGQYYENLFLIFEEADLKYNSGLFDLNKDKISKNIKIENSVIKTIVNQLYFPESPYEFSVLSVEILGSAYEQFLGKTITINDKNKVVIEQKPEVRKAGGVYYTPQYIVDYIVRNTVGKLVEGKTPKEVSEITICDPACGSGSFLLGAYQFLLDWHKNYYSENPQNSKKIKENPLTPEGTLTTAEKRRILINNIYGVDIDNNAVEVTKLSLLLKCLEGETEASINQQTKLFSGERVLPTLDKNILCGNSLIDFDFYDNNLDFGEEKKIKPFSWQKSFPSIFAKGGFDAVIGNPPWVSLSGKFGNDIVNSDALNYLISKYSGNTYAPNLYEYFVYKGLDLINRLGKFSFIVPDRLGFNSQFIELRKKILLEYRIVELLYKAHFPGIVTDTLIFQFTKKNQENNENDIVVGEFGKQLQLKSVSGYLTDPSYQFNYENNNFITQILNKIFNNERNIALSEITETTSGFGGKSKELYDSQNHKRQIKVLRGRSINKYSISQYYFFEFIKENITGRTTDKNKLGALEKVLLRKTGYPIISTYDNTGVYPEQSLYFIYNNKSELSFKYLTAIINSKIFQFVYINFLVTNKDSTPQIKKVDLDKFPVFCCDFTNNQEKEKHDKIVELVETLLQLNKEIQDVSLESKKTQIKNKIQYCEDKIDQLVYELYELTPEEIKIVEGA